MSENKKYLFKKLAFFAIVYGLFFFINLNVLDKFDDHAFRMSFDKFDRDIWRWISFYWNNWSSRILCHGSAVMLLSAGKHTFATVNAFMQTSLVFIISDYILVAANKKINGFIAVVTVFIAYLVFIPYDVRMESDLWQIATVIYLWGITSALYCIRFFYKKVYNEKINGILQYTVAILAAIYASNCEQAAPVIIAFGVITELYMKFIKRQKFTAFNWIIILITGVGFAFCLTAPGNDLRREAEMLLVMCFYPGMSLFEKVFFGVIAAIKLITQYFAPLMLVLSAVLFISVYLYKNNVVRKVTAALPCIYFAVLNLFNWMKANFPGQIIPFNADYMLYDIIPLYPQSISYSPNQWISTALALFMYILIGVLMFSSFEEKDNICLGLIYGAAFAVIAVIGFTVNGRICGARTAFVPGVLLIIVALRILIDLVSRFEFINMEK